jgi:hypothetical protein
MKQLNKFSWLIKTNGKTIKIRIRISRGHLSHPNVGSNSLKVYSSAETLSNHPER